MFPKNKPIRLKKIRDSARGMPCTVNSPWCSYNDEETVFAHYGERGRTRPVSSWQCGSGAYACSDCHDRLDGRAEWETGPYGGLESARQEREYFWFRAMRKTWRLLIINGILK